MQCALAVLHHHHMPSHVVQWHRLVEFFALNFAVDEYLHHDVSAFFYVVAAFITCIHCCCDIHTVSTSQKI